MSETKDLSKIRLRGVRHNNLKNFDLDLPMNRLIVVTGLSGSGKSSLAFDTLFAEGQRRYIETFSPYARQFFDRMDKPQVDSIEGIPPAIAIEQRNSVKSTRSTVGTLTEICDYMKVLWPHISKLYCQSCGKLVRKDSTQDIWQTVNRLTSAVGNHEALLTFDLPVSEKLSIADSIDLIVKQGYQRILLDGVPARIDESRERLESLELKVWTIIQDRIKIAPENRARVVEACEQAYHFGKGKLTVHHWIPGTGNSGGGAGDKFRFSNQFHCAGCDIQYAEPHPALFSFNHPLGACPACKGFGRIISIDYNLALPDKSKTLAQGAVKPWQTGMSAECQADLTKFCKIRKIRMDIPFNQLSVEAQQWVIQGDPNYGIDKQHEWPKAWYGIRGFFKWLESKSYKMHVRVLLSRYRAYTTCPQCEGQRFQKQSLLYRMMLPDSESSAQPLNLADFYQLSVSEALRQIKKASQSLHRGQSDPVALALNEVETRLGFLDQVGLGYLSLDRATRTLSGGETERVSLTTCLGSRLVNTLFVLDEPSVGLHPRDTEKLIHILEQLRDSGNTVVVVEHEALVMRRADEIVDIGPGHGAEGGHLVFQGPPEELMKSEVSLTGQYLSGRRQIAIPDKRPVESFDSGKAHWLELSGMTLHNLKNLSVHIPLGKLVCLTGVSGSGKTTLARDILIPALASLIANNDADLASNTLNEEDSPEVPENGESPHLSKLEVKGYEKISGVILVDQSGIAKTPRSNPCVYIGAFDFIRDLFAKTETARQQGLSSGAFSYNSAQGQCEKCRGAGFEKIEMQFLSDVFIRCSQCEGKRYRPHILEVTLTSGAEQKNIAEILSSTVDEAVIFLSRIEGSPEARKASDSLKILQEVGLGYLQLGQPVNTLSGGENQRLKLVRHLVEFSRQSWIAIKHKPSLFVFDEPTTGLHFEDVRILLQIFQKLVDTGHSVVIVEHNLDVIKCADWVIDLGPEAGEGGGQIVAQGTPESIADCAASHTGQALREVLPSTSKPATTTSKSRKEKVS